ncbi:hypothetical protein BKA61DRAFT_612122 [Leptodontidium sp. MPI-SDFR-AT-0119]|nr:hypothetical protein BKA61DRAFT_612122 [Leptodontidium sp. MPI-SDFR-AT-0119]
MTLPSSSTSVAETMARLSSKSGVTATIAIERTTSTVLQSTGTLGTMFASRAGGSLAVPGQPGPAVTSTSTNTLASSSSNPSNLERDGSGITTSDSGEEQAFNEFAKMVWNYVNATGQLVHDMDSEDELKLLRLRTRKHELVIVPDAKFLFVVVHDVPSS